jgi:hypothetical protein
VGGADCEWTNVFMLGRKRKRPFLSQHSDLLPKLLRAAISLDAIGRHAKLYRFGVRLCR